MELVDERVAPADDVAGRPPVLPERMARLRDEHVREPARALLTRAKDLQLVQALHVEGERPLRPVDLPLERIPPAEREPRRLERADGAVREPHGRLDRIVDLPVRDERAEKSSDLVDLADEIAGEVDDVCCEVSERSRASLGPVEAPHLGVGVTPVLEVAPAEVTDLPQLARVDEL